jgi:hypothetical protein
MFLKLSTGIFFRFEDSSVMIPFSESRLWNFFHVICEGFIRKSVPAHFHAISVRKSF